MARKFNKTITTPEQKEIYDKLTECLQAIANAENEERNAFGEWAKMEGKYSTGKTYSAPQQGCRGYDYEYANPEDKQKEIEEMDKYRNEVLIPLREKIAELKQESYSLDNQLCIALWGFDEDTYNLKRSIERKRKYIKELYEEIEEEKKKLEKMEKKLRKGVDKPLPVWYNKDNEREVIKMKEYKQKEIRNLVKQGMAIDITNNHSEDAIPEPYEVVGYSFGIYGTNAKLYKGSLSGKLYAVTKATSTMYRW